MLIGGRPIGSLRWTAFDRSPSLWSYVSASFSSRILVNGSALSASCLTSLARSAINSFMQPHPNQKVLNSCLLVRLSQRRGAIGLWKSVCSGRDRDASHGQVPIRVGFATSVPIPRAELSFPLAASGECAYRVAIPGAEDHLFEGSGSHMLGTILVMVVIVAAFCAIIIATDAIVLRRSASRHRH